MGMERYRTIVRLEEIRAYMESGECDAAKAVADSIRKERLKDSGDLFLLATVYRKCGEYDTAKEFLRRIYEKKVTWRVLEELMEVCLAEKNPEEAESYLQQYSKLSGGDPRNYIYEYRIGRQKHRPEEELLPILQTLKVEEYSEKYAYELAKLYHKLGREQECMTECRDLILWFGEGTYVERAKALQAYYRGELSADDIRLEAERRVREAEDRRAKEEEEQRAYEEEQRRLAEEQQRLEAEEMRRLEEEERYALEAICRSIAEERFTAEDMAELSEEDWSGTEETARETVTEPVWEAAVVPEEPERMYGDETAEEVYGEVAATELYEPMWEEDSAVLIPEQETEEAPETVEAQIEPEEYEQMSLFVAQEESVVLKEEEQAVSQLGKELATRLAERGIVFEEVLHEFGRIERVRKQLLRMLEVVVTVRKKCHCLIITGESKSGKTTLGTYLAKLLYELSYVKSPRVAKISGKRLNGLNLYEKQGQLKDVCLIVESAGEMTMETTEGLLDFVGHTDVLGTVILEDNANAMNRLLRNHAECNRMFNNRVHLPKYDSSELMGFALEYVEQQDYVITDEARHFLTQQIEYITRTEQKDGRLVATMELVKTALENADYRNQGTILAMATAGNFLAAESLELTAEDFGVIR